MGMHGQPEDGLSRHEWEKVAALQRRSRGNEVEVGHIRVQITTCLQGDKCPHREAYNCQRSSLPNFAYFIGQELEICFTCRFFRH